MSFAQKRVFSSLAECFKISLSPGLLAVETERCEDERKQSIVRSDSNSSHTQYSARSLFIKARPPQKYTSSDKIFCGKISQIYVKTAQARFQNSQELRHKVMSRHEFSALPK